MSSRAAVTVIVTPRERFSVARRAFASVAANTSDRHHFVYVAGGAPDHVRLFLEGACARPNHELIVRPHFLAPNAARNLGLARADTKYVVFLDNDVVVEPGWLDALVRCAEEEDADLVGPVCLIGEPTDQNLHSFGGTLALEDRDGRTNLRERHHFGPICLRSTSQRLTRLRSDYAEFHCALLRRSVFERIGPLDETVKGAAEHIDLALHLRSIGGRGFAEPAAMVSYLPLGYTVGDLAAYETRWSSDWHFPTMKHLVAKWGLARNADLLSDYRSDFLDKRERCLLRLEEVPDPAQPLHIAQTIVQLLDQLDTIGYEPEALLKVRDAYMVAAQLFAESFRGSGRPFLAHLVGTASILAAYGANPALIAASLHHASYAHGRFPEEIRGVAAMRRWLRRRVGDMVEGLVLAYSTLDPQAVEPDRLDDMPIAAAQAVLIRMANAIEDRQGDHNYFDSSAWLSESNDLVQRSMPVFAAVADRLGYGAMTAILQDACARAKTDRPKASVQPATPLNFAIDAKSRAIVPLDPRPLADPPAHKPPFLSGDRRHDLELGELTATNGGAVSHGRDGAALETAASAWAYSAYLRPHLTGLTGPAVVEIRLRTDRGQIGVLVLERGSSVFAVAPEQSVMAETDKCVGPGQATLLHFEIAAVEEIGDIVFRGWPHADGAAKARIFAISLVTDQVVTAASHLP
jgi:hypothetical protein